MYAIIAILHLVTLSSTSPYTTVSSVISTKVEVRETFSNESECTARLYGQNNRFGGEIRSYLVEVRDKDYGFINVPEGELLPLGKNSAQYKCVPIVDSVVKR